MKVLKNLSLLCIIIFNGFWLTGQSTKNENVIQSDFQKSSLRFLPIEFDSDQFISLSESSFNYKTDIDNWPFFCKWEEKWRQKYRMPAKIRLGTVDYVNLLENK